MSRGAAPAAAVERAERLAAEISERGFDQLLVGDLVRPGDSERAGTANLRYLTGFSGTSGLCLVGPGERVFVTDFRYVERAAREVPEGFERVRAERQLLPTVAERLRGRVGFDDANTSVRSLSKLEELAPDGVELVPAAGLVERLRRSKDGREVNAIAEAARLADEVYEWTAERGLAGRTEREVALAAEQRMRELGAEGPSFPAIVAAGPNGSLPHAEASEREIEPGELVVVDMGAIVDGYCSDCTRTLATGEVSDEVAGTYGLVRDAQAAALAKVAAGVAARDVDAAARERIDAAGHGDEFGHGVGHGVGIEVHEEPRLAARSEDELVAGDVVTIEPGVYVAGRFGVRIEDLVVVDPDGVRNLSSFPKELQVVG
ncbi:MAG TPA: Xaa-Pro peptidase family protein [Solirubrobacterales bacterium]|nr:Xaa-Pro peptidase family protein [Solirubrobacterales bacterium]